MLGVDSMKIFDKHQFVKAAYIEAKKRSIFPIKKKDLQ